MMTTTSQLTLSHTCYCTHCHSLTLHTSHTPHTSHTLHTLHFAWHLFLFRIMTFITKNRNLFCVHVTVINFCLKTLQTPAEEIRVDMLVNLRAIATCISQSNHWPLNWVKLQFQLCLVQRSNVWSGKLISRVGGGWRQGWLGVDKYYTNNYVLVHCQKRCTSRWPIRLVDFSL